MTNAGKYIRQLYDSLLDEILWNGEKVPLIQSQSALTLPRKFIEIKGVETSNVLNDSKFMSEVTITIEVVTAQYKYQNRDTADEIAQNILYEIVPTIGGTLVQDYFIIGHVQLESSRYLEEIDEQGNYITRKILVFNQTIIQK